MCLACEEDCWRNFAWGKRRKRLLESSELLVEFVLNVRFVVTGVEVGAFAVEGDAPGGAVGGFTGGETWATIAADDAGWGSTSLFSEMGVEGLDVGKVGAANGAVTLDETGP